MKRSTGNILVLLGAAAAPTLAGAFGLGEVRVHSDLGQPLDVTIPLSLERNEVLSRLHVEIASPAAYIDAGLEWPAVLRKAVVSLEQGRDGNPYVRIHSDERVSEPILPILLEARINGMSLHRDYSVLLDLPAGVGGRAPARPASPLVDHAPVPFQAPPAPGTASLEAQAAATPTPTPSPAQADTQAETAARVAAAPGATAQHAAAPHPRRAGPAPVDGRATVLEGEGLGELAQRVRADPRIPLRRMMLAIYQANPEAFNGSMDLLWSGVEIRVPAVGEVDALARAANPHGAPRAARGAHPLLTITARAAPVDTWTLPSVPGRLALKFINHLTLRPSMSLQMAGALTNPPALPSAEPAAPEAAPSVAQAAAPALPALKVMPAITALPGAGSGKSGFSWVWLALLALLGYGAARFNLVERARLAWASRRGDEKTAEAKAVEQARPPVVAPQAAPVASARPIEIAQPETRSGERLMSITPEALQAGPATPAANTSNAGAVPPAAAAATIAAPPRTAATPSKIVSIKRREENAIEVVEAPVHAATGTDGSLNGFYADVAQMLAAALQQDPRRRDLRLKLLEVYFSAGLADEYLTQTRAYLDELKGQNDESWADIADMGRKLAPGHEWFAMSTPPRLPAAGDESSKTTATPKRNFNRYYEGVDQWRLRGALEDLAQQYQVLARDPSFTQMQSDLLQKLAGRPTLLIHASALSQKVGGAQIFLKREPRHGSGDDHLINAIGQCALAKRMGRRGVVAATSNGLHGLAVAAVAKSLGLECGVFMDEKDMRAHYPRVLRMREFGAKVEDVHHNQALPGEYDVRRAALTAWLEQPKETLYISSLSSGPHPYPMIMQSCQAVVGRETRAQMALHSQRPPAAVIAGTADGPGVVGLLHSFLDETQTRLFCVESSRSSHVRDRLTVRSEGPDLELTEHNWPREHNWLKETRRVTYGKVSEQEAILAMQQAYETEKLMLSQEGAQVVAFATRVAKELRNDQTVVLLLPSQNDADARLMEHASTRQIRMDVG